MKRGWAFAPKASQKSDLACLQRQSDSKHLLQNQNHYETDLNGRTKHNDIDLKCEMKSNKVFYQKIAKNDLFK